MADKQARKLNAKGEKWEPDPNGGLPYHVLTSQEFEAAKKLGNQARAARAADNK